jgi:hypothetical protein
MTFWISITFWITGRFTLFTNWVFFLSAIHWPSPVAWVLKRLASLNRSLRDKAHKRMPLTFPHCKSRRDVHYHLENFVCCDVCAADCGGGFFVKMRLREYQKYFLLPLFVSFFNRVFECKWARADIVFMLLLKFLPSDARRPSLRSFSVQRISLITFT